MTSREQRADAVALLAQPEPRIERTCSFRLRPVWILSATAPACSFSLRMTSVWTSSSVAPS